MYNFAVDFWSLGVLIYEMLTGNTPFDDASAESSLFDAIEYKKIEYPSFLSLNAKYLIDKLLERNPLLRLGSKNANGENIRRLAFFWPIDWAKLENGEVEPPFKPKVSSSSDVSNFDSIYTQQEPVLTKLESNKKIDADFFKNFSFTETHFLI
jgi:serine/threonine protein kinase